MLEVEDGEIVGSGGGGVPALFYGSCGVFAGKRGEGRVQGMLFFNLSECLTEVGVLGVDVDACELFSELLGYCGGLGVDLVGAFTVFERDGLVRGDFGSCAGKGSDGVPESF